MSNCFFCKEKNEENSEIQTSHDVPCYLFEGKTRKERKQKADKFGRHNLCLKCHNEYENYLLKILVRNLTNEEIQEIFPPSLKVIYMNLINKIPKEKKEVGIKICKKIAEEYYGK